MSSRVVLGITEAYLPGLALFGISCGGCQDSLLRRGVCPFSPSCLLAGFPFSESAFGSFLTTDGKVQSWDSRRPLGLPRPLPQLEEFFVPAQGPEPSGYSELGSVVAVPGSLTPDVASGTVCPAVPLLSIARPSGLRRYPRAPVVWVSVRVRPFGRPPVDPLLLLIAASARSFMGSHSVGGLMVLSSGGVAGFPAWPCGHFRPLLWESEAVCGF